MRERIWTELVQCKHNHTYCVKLIGYRRSLLNTFNIIILVFSSAGAMGWSIWQQMPILSCIIVAIISLLKLISPHIIPSDKQLDKLDSIIDFYFDYYNKIEQLWYDHYNERINDLEAQAKFYEIKITEKETNKVINEIIKKTNNSLAKKTKIETDIYFRLIFNVQS